MASKNLENLENLLNWASSNGAYISKSIQFNHSTKLGAHATTTSKIEPFVPLLRIPEALLLTASVAEKHYGIKADPSDNSLLLSFLAMLKFDHKPTEVYEKFRPYLEYLSEDAINIAKSPIVWSDDELQIIHGTELWSLAQSRLSVLQSQWKKSQKTSSSSADSNNNNNLSYTAISSSNGFAAFVWAANVLFSRGFPNIVLHSHNSANHAFLLPVIDLLNHDEAAKISWKFVDSHVVFSSLIPVAASSLVSNNYGTKSAAETILTYGYVPSVNSVSITIKADNLAKELAAEHNILFDGPHVEFRLSFHTPVPANFVRFFAALNSLTSEKGQYTLRMHLHGIQQARQHVDQVINMLRSRTKGPLPSKVRPDVGKLARDYLKAELKVFQATSQALEQLLKKVIQQYKPGSFKTALKKASFGIHECSMASFAAWTACAVNQETKFLPSFVQQCYKDAENVVDAEDMEEERHNYAKYADKGISLKQFTVGTIVADRLGFVRENGDLYIVHRMTIEGS